MCNAAEHLGIPYLSAYLNSIKPNFEHGANFATRGATIRQQNEAGSKIMLVLSLLIFNSPSLMSSRHKQPTSLIKVTFFTHIIFCFMEFS